MEPVWNTGLAIIVMLQSLGDWLTLPMRALSVLGLPGFYVFLIPACTWCLDTRLGLRLTICLMSSIWLSETAKVALHQPRPFWLSEQISALGADGSFGIPSGHAQNSVAIWGLLAYVSKRRWVWLVAALLAFAIGISRIYLGVHFPSDVLAGWLVGALVLWAFLRWETRLRGVAVVPCFRKGVAGLALTTQIIVAFSVSVVMLVLCILSVFAQGGWQMPPLWLSNAHAVVGPVFDPSRIDFAVMAAGLIFGTAAGASLISRAGGFHVDGAVLQRLARLPLGIVVAGALWWMIGRLVPELGQPWDYAALYLRAALMGLWVSAGAPRLFVLVRLAGSAARDWRSSATASQSA